MTCPAESLDLNDTFVDSTLRKGKHSNRSVLSWGVTRFSMEGTTSGHSDMQTMSTALFLDLYALADEAGEIKLVSWLSAQDFDFYTSPEGEAFLQGKLDKVVVGAEVVACAKERFVKSRWHA